MGVMGGTFDPIHYGHLSAAQGAFHLFELELVAFIPANQPPHKPVQAISAAEHRLQMIQLAIQGNDAFRVLTLELERPGPSYSIDTVRLLRERFPQYDLYFILGADNLYQIQSWKEYEELLRLCWFIAVTRPGFPRRPWEALQKRLGSELSDRIHFTETPGVAVASSQIRQLSREGYPIRYLVPEAVQAYIHQHKLYTP